MSEMKNISPDLKVRVVNLADWDVTIKSPNTVSGAIIIPARGNAYTTFAVLESAVSQGHKIVCGNDGSGSHARIYIENGDVREALGFDDTESGRKQLVVTKDSVKEIFAIKRFEDFKKSFNELIVEPFERTAVMRHIAELKINDFGKIRFAEQTTGVRLY